MKKIFFDIDNGSVVKPREITAPEYYALVYRGLRISEIHTAFSSEKIKIQGYSWLHELLHKECFQLVNYRWLMNSLKNHIREFVNYGDKDDYDIDYQDQYIYMKFWQSEEFVIDCKVITTPLEIESIEITDGNKGSEYWS